jgi:ABC-type antimicrobial peptide transport system permease subunit
MKVIFIIMLSYIIMLIVVGILVTVGMEKESINSVNIYLTIVQISFIIVIIKRIKEIVTWHYQ